MIDLGEKADLGAAHRVLGRQKKLEPEHATFIGSPQWSRDHHIEVPHVVLVGRGANTLAWFREQTLRFLLDARIIPCHRYWGLRTSWVTELDCLVEQFDSTDLRANNRRESNK